MNKQQLSAKIWESANKMRSKIEANEYKDYILGFIFYKFLSEKEVEYLKKNDWTDEYLPELTEEDKETVTSVQKNIGYFISYENLFSTWLEMGKDFRIEHVHDALSAFNRNINSTHKRVFEKIFDTLQTGLSKLGDNSASQSKAIRDLVYLIKDIPMDGKQDYDVLGFIYEDLIRNFASNAGKKAGEFYTPHEVSLLMSDIVAHHLQNRKEIKIYDPTSGSGSLLITIGKSTARYMKNRNNIKYYAQELKQNTYNLTRMNLVMRGILPDNIVTRCGDTLEEDWPYFDENDPAQTYDPLYVDAVVSNPPYSQSWDPTGKENDVRFARFGLAPKGKADYAFLLHDLFHVKDDGIMTIVLPHGVLFRGGEEGEIRRNLIEQNHIDAIIGLPANIFYGTGIPTIIMVLKQKRENNDVLIIDASKGFIKEGKNNRLRACDIKRIVDTVTDRRDVPKFAKKVSREEIRRNDYNLNIPRYVDSSEEAESWDIYASMFGGIPEKELDSLQKYWSAFPHLREELFREVSPGYCEVKASDIKSAVQEHEDVQLFRKQFCDAFRTLEDALHRTLVEEAETVNAVTAESEFTDDIFTRLKDIPLVDSYEAYQLLHDSWETVIENDLEMIHTEGPAAATQVDPNLVLKKKNGKDQEVQDGWKGHILPFELVQDALLSEEKEAISVKENRLAEIVSEYEEIFESLDEEEKAADYSGENGFVWSEVKKAIKAGALEPETLQKLTDASKLNEEEKKLKSAVKKGKEALELQTKDTIENLCVEQVKELLHRKWITPLVQNLLSLPNNAVDALISELNALNQKYETTFAELESQIAETETQLSAMMDELTGSETDLLGLSELRKLLGGE